MKVSPVKSILTNPKAAEFAQNTINAIAVETTLKAIGRPTFIYYDKNANGNSKKYAATKELLYQSFCLGLYLGFINKVKKPVYGFVKNHFFKTKEDIEKLDLFDTFQKQIDEAKTKENKKALHEQLMDLVHTDKRYKLGKGVHEFSSIISTVFILALCAPILSQIILHPVMDLIFKKDKKGSKNVAKTENTQQPQVKAKKEQKANLAVDKLNKVTTPQSK